MLFKQYLIEYFKAHNNEADLVFHKILDNVNHGHVDFQENKLLFNVGNIIKNSKYAKLYLVIRHGTDEKVRLGADKQGNLNIVIDTEKKLPSHTELHSFLDDAKIIKDFKREFTKVLRQTPDSDEAPELSTSHEIVKDSNANFEDIYKNIIKLAEKNIHNYKEAIKHLEERKTKTVHASKHSVIASAMEKLHNDAFGDSFGTFRSKIFKDFGEKINHLTADNKKKLISRLESFYEQKVKSI